MTIIITQTDQPLDLRSKNYLVGAAAGVAAGALGMHLWMKRKRKNPTSNRGLDTFTLAYIEAALWSSTDNSDDSGGEPFDKNYSIDDIDSKSLISMKRDAEAFENSHWNDIKSDVERAGHDFWLNRNGHGAGFWDGDWPEPAATRLDKASKAFGESDLYLGDDGQIHVSPIEPRSKRIKNAKAKRSYKSKRSSLK